MRRLATVVVLIVAPAGALVLLLAPGTAPEISVDWSDPAGWLARSRPEDALVAVLRWVAIALCAWLLLGTLLGLVTVGRPAGAGSGVVRRITGRRLWHLLERALAVSAVTGASFTAASPGGAGTPPATVQVEIDVRTGRAETPIETPSTAPPPASLGDDPAPVPAPAPNPDTGPAQAHHVVVAGENLWTIAADEIARRTGRTAGRVAEVEIAPYWIEVLAANEGTLRSGDPNLIYPGEVVTLPA